MSRALILLVVASCTPTSMQAGSEGGQAVRDEPQNLMFCSVRLQFEGLVTQNVEIRPDRVRGADYNLHVEDQVVYGFISGEPTRFKIEDGNISGTAGGKELMLHLRQTRSGTEIRGLINVVQVKALITEDHITVSAPRGVLFLTQDRRHHLSGQLEVRSHLASAHFTTFGCEFDDIRARPELIVVLFMWWLGG